MPSTRTAGLSTAEDEAEKEVRSLTLLSSGRDAAGQVPTGEWEAMTWVERLARLKSAESAKGDFGDEWQGPLKLGPGPAFNSLCVMSKHTRMHACGSCRLNCMITSF